VSLAEKMKTNGWKNNENGYPHLKIDWTEGLMIRI
jgi:hypothetical protein